MLNKSSHKLKIHEVVIVLVLVKTLLGILRFTFVMVWNERVSLEPK